MSYQQPPQGPPPPAYNPDPSDPAGQPPQRKGRRRGTRRLVWGVILMVVGIVGGIIAAIAFGFSAAGQFENFADDSYEIQQPVSVDGLGDNQWYIYQPDMAAGSITCEVTDESGQNIVSENMSSTVETDEYSYEAVQSFSSQSDGVYEISCSDYPVIIGGVAPLGGIFGAIGAVLVGGLVFIVGLVLTIIGAVVRSRSKRAMPPSGPQYGGGYAGNNPEQPYDPGQQYGQRPPQG